MILFSELIKKIIRKFISVNIRRKKTQMSRFINTELKSDSEKIGARVDNELEKSGSDSE